LYNPFRNGINIIIDDTEVNQWVIN
jgi:hypothetical protein